MAVALDRERRTHFGSQTSAGYGPVVVRGIALPPLGPAIQILQLHAQHRGLQLVDAKVTADEGVVVLRLAAMHPQHTHPFRELGILRGAQTRIAESPQIFTGKERKAANVAECAGMFTALIGGTDGLGGILDHLETVLTGNGHQGVHVGRLTVQMDRHQGPDAPLGGAVYQLSVAYRTMVIDEGLDRGRRQVEGQRIDIAEHRPRTRACDGSGRCKKGKRRGDDFIAGADLEGHEGKQQGIGARRHPDSGRGPAIAGNFFLQSAHLLAQDEVLTGAYPLLDGPAVLRPEFAQIVLSGRAKGHGCRQQIE